jgi:hypothetical protein
MSCDHATLETDDLIRILVDPYYAINVAPDIAADHQPIITKIDWIKANRCLIDEPGADQWLVYLLSILEGEYPRQPEDTAILEGYSPDDE